jgi:hypothetical protein
MKELDWKSTLVAAAIGAVLFYFLAEDSSASNLGKGAAVGIGVQIGVRLLGVS